MRNINKLNNLKEQFEAVQGWQVFHIDYLSLKDLEQKNLMNTFGVKFICEYYVDDGFASESDFGGPGLYIAVPAVWANPFAEALKKRCPYVLIHESGFQNIKNHLMAKAPLFPTEWEF